MLWTHLIQLFVEDAIDLVTVGLLNVLEAAPHCDSIDVKELTNLMQVDWFFLLLQALV